MRGEFIRFTGKRQIKREREREYSIVGVILFWGPCHQVVVSLEAQTISPSLLVSQLAILT